MIDHAHDAPPGAHAFEPDKLQIDLVVLLSTNNHSATIIEEWYVHIGAFRGALGRHPANTGRWVILGAASSLEMVNPAVVTPLACLQESSVAVLTP